MRNRTQRPAIRKSRAPATTSAAVTARRPMPVRPTRSSRGA